MKNIKINIVSNVLVIFLLAQTSFAQHIPMIYKPYLNKHYGYAITADNDTLSGYFYIGYVGKSIIYNADDNTLSKYVLKTDSLLEYGSIKSVFLKSDYSNDFYNTGDYVEFVYFQDFKQFFRKLYVGNQHVYYDEKNKPSDKLSHFWLITSSDGEKEKLGSDFKSGKNTLVDYLNNLFSTSYSYKYLEKTFDVVVEIESLRSSASR